MEEPILGNGIEPVMTDEDLECSGGIYRCRDDILNFKFRIKVKKVNPVAGSSSLSASSLTLGSGTAGRTDSNDSLRSEPEGEGSTERGNAEKDKDLDMVEDVIIQWQQKKFSKQEIKYYSDAKEEDFHHNVLKKKFYRDVHALTKRKGKSVPLNKMESNRIYTLVDGELDIAEEVKLYLNHIVVTDHFSSAPFEYSTVYL